MKPPKRLRLRAVVFDLDGTLVDTMESAPQAYADTIRVLGGPDVSVDDIVAMWHVGPTSVVLAHFLRRKTSSEDLECFYQHFETGVATVQPFPDVVEMLEALNTSGYGLGVFTTATRRAAILVLETAGLHERFATVVGGDEVNASKPAADGLLLACRRAGVATREVAYVGDSGVDMLCAAAAGALAIHAAWGRPVATIAGFHTVAPQPADVVEIVRRSNERAPGRA